MLYTPTSNTFLCIAKTLHGLEGVLSDELQALGATDILPLKRAVEFKADHALLYKANYTLRTCLKVLVPIYSFNAKDGDTLYQRASDIPWPDYFGINRTFAIDTTIRTQWFNHPHFVAQRVKDAIADRFRKDFGRRPSVDPKSPDVWVHIHMNEDQVTILLDSSGDPLFKRGYRTSAGIAPLNEVLAAGMLALSGWQKDIPLVDGMCGSGTIAIEAAMISAGIPAQRERDYFSFMGWSNYENTMWDGLVDSYKYASNAKTIILANDLSRRAINDAQINIRNAGVQDIIRLQQGDFRRCIKPAEEGFLFLNPPYGERLEVSDDLIDLYASIGDTLKKQFTGWKAWIISSNREAMKHIGLKTSAKETLFNGSLECAFWKYEMYSGKKETNISK